MSKPLLDWFDTAPSGRGTRPGAGKHAVMGGRGRIAFYKVHRAATGDAFYVSSYLTGAMQDTKSFPDFNAAQAYAETDFAAWLQRTGLGLRPDIEKALRAAEGTYAALERNEKYLREALQAKGLPSSWLGSEIAKAAKIRAALHG